MFTYSAIWNFPRLCKLSVRHQLHHHPHRIHSALFITRIRLHHKIYPQSSITNEVNRHFLPATFLTKPGPTHIWVDPPKASHLPASVKMETAHHPLLFNHHHHPTFFFLLFFLFCNKPFMPPSDDPCNFKGCDQLRRGHVCLVTKCPFFRAPMDHKGVGSHFSEYHTSPTVMEFQNGEWCSLLFFLPFLQKIRTFSFFFLGQKI